MLVNEPSLTFLEWAYRTMGLPEPLVFCHREDGPNGLGRIVGIIDGWIHVEMGIAQVEHMIVLPSARRKFHVMMQMSKDATAALHARGLDVVLKIHTTDTRSGLRAWAKRMKYEPYAEDHEAVWYISRRKEETSYGGQEQAAAEAAARAATA